MRARSVRVLACALALLLVLPGCVQWNPTVWELNRHVGVALRPVVAILLIVPEPLRERFRLFLKNLRYGDVVTNQLLQGKPELAARDLLRWIVNSSLGIAGAFDVAKDMGLPEHEEDFGQTLAVWGFPQGEYVVLPFVGPTTHRDMVGFAVAFFTNPNFYVPETLISTPITVLSYANQAVDAREGLARVAGEAADPYAFVREAYLQRRRFLIYDGHPPSSAAADVAALDALDLEGLEGAEAGSEEVRSPDDLEGLEESRKGERVRSADDLPGLEDVLERPSAGDEGAQADDLPGLDAADEGRDPPPP